MTLIATVILGVIATGATDRIAARARAPHLRG